MADSGYYSINDFPGDGSQTTFEVSFAGGYISRSHISARLFRDSDKTFADVLFDWVNSYTVRVSAPVPVGYTLRVYRKTPIEQPLVDYSDGALLSEVNLDTANKQAIFAAAEAVDAFGTVPGNDALRDATAALVFARSRSNHTGVQAIGTVSGLQTALDAKAAAATVAALSSALDLKASAIAWPSVTDARFLGGAKGDGIADDTAAIKAALLVCKYLWFPPGVYKITETLTLRNGQQILGAGKAAWEPYDLNPTTNPGLKSPAFKCFKTLIVTDGRLAFNMVGLNSTKVCGLAVASVGGSLSSFGTPAAYQAGAKGFDITSGQQLELDDVSFHGLEIGVDSNQDEGLPAGSPLRAASCQMPSITRWAAADNHKVFRFGNAATVPRTGIPGGDTNPYTVRDGLIGECIIALHNNVVIDAHYCDGLRIENVRFFQAYDRTVYVRECPYLNISDCTFFETAGDQLVLEACKYVTLGNLLLSRAGCYKVLATGQTFNSKTAVTLLNCTGLSFTGSIVQPGGRPIQITGCNGVQIAATLYQSFWTNGNPTAASGSVDIRTSTGVVLSVSEANSANWIGVWADEASAPFVSGDYVTDGPQGCVRANLGNKALTRTVYNPATNGVGPGGSSTAFANLRLRVPPGKSLVTRSVQMTSGGIRLRSGSIYWSAAGSTTEDTDGGSVNVEQKVLASNTGTVPIWFVLPLQFYNPTGNVINVPEGHETIISFGYVNN